MAQTRAQKLAQARFALQQANETRIKRGKLRRDLKAGRIGMADVLEDIPPWLATARVHDFVLALPRVGPQIASVVLWRSGVPASWRFGQLSKEQREALTVRLDYKKEWRLEAAALLEAGLPTREVAERVGRHIKTVEEFRRESRDA